MTIAVILAGGLGTRLRSVVPDVPKPMAPINGRPFLEHQIEYWLGQGVDRFILSIGYKSNLISDHFGNNYKGADIDYVVEDNPLGTGGGLLLALEKVVDSKALVLNGDTFFSVSLKQLCLTYADTQADCVFSLFRTMESDRYMGINLSKGGEIKALTHEDTARERIANGGVYLINTKAVKSLKLAENTKISLESEIFSQMMNSGKKIFGHVFDEKFIDIGLPKDYLRAAKVLR